MRAIKGSANTSTFVVCAQTHVWRSNLFRSPFHAHPRVVNNLLGNQEPCRSLLHKVCSPSKLSSTELFLQLVQPLIINENINI